MVLVRVVVKEGDCGVIGDESGVGAFRCADLEGGDGCDGVAY